MAFAHEMVGEGAECRRGAGDDIDVEFVQRVHGRSERCGAPYRQPDVGDGGAVQGIQDEGEARVELAGIEEVGDPVAGSQSGLDETAAECGGEFSPFFTGIDRELRGAGGSAALEDHRIIERTGQQTVLAGSVGSPECVLGDDRQVRQLAYSIRKAGVEVPVKGRVATYEAYEFRQWLNGH